MKKICFLCLLLPFPVMAQELGKDWEIIKIAREAEIKPGTMVEVYNDYGDIRARSAPDQIVAYSAMIQKYTQDAKTLDFQIDQKEGKLVIRTVYAGPDDDTVKGSGKRRADVTVFIPKGSTYLARTEKGLIEAKGIHGDVDLKSNRGKIFVRSSGMVNASTGQGEITAYLLAAKWEKPLMLETGIGNISVHLPREVSVMVQAQTAGELTTDYSIDIKRDQKTRVKHATAKIGGGESRLSLKSKQGAIKILHGLWITPPPESDPKH